MKNKKSPQTRPSGPFFVIAGMAMLLAIVVALRNIKVDRVLKKENPVLVRAERFSPYSTEQLHNFWDQELRALVEDEWLASKLPYPEINAHLSTLRGQVFMRTKKPLRISMVPRYHSLNKRIPASFADTADAEAEINLFIPSILDEYKRFKSSGLTGWHEVFRTDVIITLTHELEHAQKGARLTQVSIAEESRTEAEVCRYTSVPLVEKYRLRLHPTREVLYRAWKASSADTNHPIWLRAISNLYSPFLQ